MATREEIKEGNMIKLMLEAITVILFLVALAYDLCIGIFNRDREYGHIRWYARWVGWVNAKDYQRQIKEENNDTGT